MESADVAIIVLGCSVNEDGSPSEWLRLRLEAAAAESARLAESHVLVLSGAAVRSVITEAECMRAWLVANSAVAPERLMLEEQATDTLENVHYSLLLLLRPGACPALRRLIFVTSDFHLARGAALLRGELAFHGAEWLGVTEVGAPTPDLTGEQLLARRERERRLLANDLQRQRARHAALRVNN